LVRFSASTTSPAFPGISAEQPHPFTRWIVGIRNENGVIVTGALIFPVEDET
jgi:hypothetical protein